MCDKANDGAGQENVENPKPLNKEKDERACERERKKSRTFWRKPWGTPGKKPPRMVGVIIPRTQNRARAELQREMPSCTKLGSDQNF